MIPSPKPNKPPGHVLWSLGLMLVVLSTTTGALAAGEAPGWRPAYDLVMRWINFALLVFLLIKFGKGPVKNFLNARREEMARQIRKLETEKAVAEKEVDRAMAALTASDARMETLRKRLILEGERERDAIVEAARIHSRQMMTGAQSRARTRILEARAALRCEMVDLAMERVLATLPHQFTDQDDHRLADQFLLFVSAK